VVTPSSKNNVKKRQSPDWLSTWEYQAKLKGTLPDLTVDVKLEGQTKSAPWFRVQIIDIHSEHALSSSLLQGFFRAGDVSLQFFHSSSKYCLLSLREASRPSPQFRLKTSPNMVPRPSSARYGSTFSHRFSGPTTTIHENEIHSALALQQSVSRESSSERQGKKKRKCKRQRPAIFVNYENTLRQRQETKDDLRRVISL